MVSPLYSAERASPVLLDWLTELMGPPVLGFASEWNRIGGIRGLRTYVRGVYG